MTAALLAYWHQVACFRSAEGQAGRDAAWVCRSPPPLWVLLGLSVIGSRRTRSDKQQTSDVVDVLSLSVDHAGAAGPAGREPDPIACGDGPGRRPAAA